ncbi:MAG: hypothetical protein OEZ54_02060 [Gemmatimonadota bacterium]|nr:hypothetical protein [Gemmatimonadota bacterium]
MTQVRNRLWVLGTVLLAASCATQVTTVQPSEEIEAAMGRFMEAVQADDIEGMGRLWGTKDGPMNGRLDQEALEMRLRVMQVYLRHDSFELAPIRSAFGLRGTEIAYQMTITRGACTDTVPVVMVRWRNQWLLQSVDLDAMRNPARPCSRE